MVFENYLYWIGTLETVYKIIIIIIIIIIICIIIKKEHLKLFKHIQIICINEYFNLQLLTKDHYY